MSIGLGRDRWRQFHALDRAEQVRIVSAMSAIDLLRMDADFEAWANDGQLEPGGEGWSTWLMMAGRGFGKTRAGAEWVMQLASRRGVRIALVGATMDEARSVMVEGDSGILTLARARGERIKWEPSKGILSWPRGGQAQLFSGDNPEALRGPQHHFAWADELAKWRRADEAWRNLEMGMRCGIRPRALVTTTPRSMGLIEELRKRASTIETHGRTSDNVTLSRRFVELMVATYGGTRWGRQELDGELMDEAENSLFPRALLDKARAAPVPPGAFDRIVVGVDPPAGTNGDACGIVVAGRRDGVIHVIADASIAACAPERWATQVAETARIWNASHVVAEANQGGAMVASVLNAADCAMRVKLVHASSGKSARAEPVAVRMETGRVKLGGLFVELEAELAGLQLGGRYERGGSPDRADAMVWAVTELSELKSGVPRVRAL